MADAGKLVYKASGGNAGKLCFRASGSDAGKLVYKVDASSENDARVYIDFDPKMWTCLAYGADHDVRLSVKPSWQSSTSTIDSMTSFYLPYATIAGGNTFTIALDALTHCDAEVYPTITSMLVVQQPNVGTFTMEIKLSVGVQSRATIRASNGRIISLD